MSLSKLLPSEVIELKSILEAGISRSTYNLVANYLAPKGFNWMMATHFGKLLDVNFKGADFAEMWYKPAQIYDQQKQVKLQGYETPVSEKYMIQKPLDKEARFMYTVTYDINDADGFYVSTSGMSFYSDDKMSPEDIIYTAENKLGMGENYSEIKTDNVEYKATYHNSGWDY